LHDATKPSEGEIVRVYVVKNLSKNTAPAVLYLGTRLRWVVSFTPPLL